MTYDDFQASEEKPDKKAKTKASKRKRSPSPPEKKVNLFRFLHAYRLRYHRYMF